jgi:hypothetical protein
MLTRKLVVVLTLGVVSLALLLLALPRQTSEALGADRAEVPAVAAQPVAAPVAQAAAATPLILQYAAKFVCMEPLQPGAYYYGPAAPLVKESTGVVIHNPNSYPVRVYKKAVRASLEEDPPIAPGKWLSYTIGPDYAFRIDCDDIAKLLTNNPAATFIGTYGIGVEVEGMVVIAIGPQANAAGTPLRYAPLDVTSEYVRGSEVLKKDIHYQPWWWWWWWPLPWRLGYAYERMVPIQNVSVNIDCRGLLYGALRQDAQDIADTTQRTQTLAALDVGNSLDPTHMEQINGETAPALVTLIGRCNKIYLPGTSGPGSWVAEIDYALVSNKGPTDPDPRGTLTKPEAVLYPWWPGRWYDLPVVMPQNRSTDIDAYFRQWHAQQWIAAGTPASTVNAAMVYWFPYWCGWGYWSWWWNGGDCIDIGVGEGESLDVEQVAPTRVYMNVWPPQ